MIIKLYCREMKLLCTQLLRKNKVVGKKGCVVEACEGRGRHQNPDQQHDSRGRKHITPMEEADRQRKTDKCRGCIPFLTTFTDLGGCDI